LKDNTNVNKILKIDASPEVNGFYINKKIIKDYQNSESDHFQTLTERVVILRLITTLEEQQPLAVEFFCSRKFSDCLNLNWTKLFGWKFLESFGYTSYDDRKMVKEMK
jgi:hypothetical protein